jgi:hypothetical protein
MLLASCLLGACTQDFNVFVSDASVDVEPGDVTANDSPLDAPPKPDGGSDGGYQCGTDTVASCTACTGMPQPCLFCGTGTATAGVCVGMGMSCFGSAPTGFGVCACGMSANACLASYQVCRLGECRTCSESAGNVGYTCNGGGTCNPQDGGCF